MCTLGCLVAAVLMLGSPAPGALEDDSARTGGSAPTERMVVGDLPSLYTQWCGIGDTREVPDAR